LPKQAVELQRTRILEATLEIVAVKGLRGITIDAVTRRACVSRVTFKEHFGTIEQAFVDLVEQVTTRSVDVIRDAFELETSWSAGVLAGLEALLTFLDSNPSLARVCLIEALAGPPAALERRAQLLESLATLLDGARGTTLIDKPSEVTTEAAIALVLGVLHKRTVAGQAPPFINLLGELAGLVLAPYLGSVEAAEIARIGDGRSEVIARERAARPPDLRERVPKQLLHANAKKARECLCYVAEWSGPGFVDSLGLSWLVVDRCCG
jgi:AcrR family transcriptional regulator